VQELLNETLWPASHWDAHHGTQQTLDGLNRNRLMHICAALCGDEHGVVAAGR